MARTGFFIGEDAKLLGGSPSRVGTNSQGRTNSIFSFRPLCNCPTITSYCCVAEVERSTLLRSIFNPGLQPFSLARQAGQSWRPAYAL